METQHPIETLELGAESISAIDGTWVEDQNAVGHVFSNQDYTHWHNESRNTF